MARKEKGSIYDLEEESNTISYVFGQFDEGISQLVAKVRFPVYRNFSANITVLEVNDSSIDGGRRNNENSIRTKPSNGRSTIFGHYNLNEQLADRHRITLSKNRNVDNGARQVVAPRASEKIDIQLPGPAKSTTVSTSTWQLPLCIRYMYKHFKCSSHTPK